MKVLFDTSFSRSLRKVKVKWLKKRVEEIIPKKKKKTNCDRDKPSGTILFKFENLFTDGIFLKLKRRTQFAPFPI